MIDWKSLYIKKNRHLETLFKEVTPFEFYRNIFPVGTFERLGWPEDSKPNGLALDIQGKGKAFHYIVTDGLEQLESLLEHDFVIMSPISYFGQRRNGKNARYLHALTFDLDGVEMPNLRDVLHQMNKEILPTATYVVNSGRGLHLYYVLENPIPLYPQNQRYLKELKYALTRQIWNRYTSNRKDVESQGILQGFRMVGSPTKLGKEYSTKAFRHGGRVTLEYLLGFVPETSGELTKIQAALKKSKLSLEEAKKKYPEWYDRRVVRNERRGHWTVKRDLYDWWRNRLLSEIKVGHRFYGVMTLAIYAKKCGISEDELRKDAYSILPLLDGMSEEKENRFEDTDIESALELYNEDYVTFPRDDIVKLTGLPMVANKRNGRKQAEHLQRARIIQRANDEVDGTNWREKNGRPSKRHIVEGYLREHPEETNKSAIAKSIGLSRPTVIKYYDDIADTLGRS